MTTPKRIIACTLALLGLCGSHAASADMLADLKKAGVLRVATPTENPPFGVTGPDMKIVGYDIDMAKLLARKLGLQLEMVSTSSANRIAYLQAQKVDVIVSSLGKNPDREKVLDFSVRYAPYFLGVYSHKKVEAANAAALGGKTIGVARGAIDDAEVTRIAPATTEIRRFEDASAAASAFMSEQVQVVVLSNVAAGVLARQYPSNPPVMNFALKDSPCFIGVPKGETALLAKIDEIVKEAKADGTLNRMARTWFQADLPADF